MDISIGLCVRGERIAPRYDQPEKLVFVICDARHRETGRSYMNAVNMKTSEICEALLTSGITTLICGGIKGDCQVALHKAGVRIIDNVIGEIDSVLREYCAGRLLSGAIVD